MSSAAAALVFGVLIVVLSGVLMYFILNPV